MRTTVPVLMYHALEDSSHPSGAKNPGEQLYVLQAKQFREQLEYLKQAGFQTFFLEELITMQTWPKKAVVLTFDDGHESNYILALPILREFSFKAEFYITTGFIGKRHHITLEGINILCDAGMKIGSHGKSHAFLSDLDDEAIRDELVSSRDCIANIIGTPISVFSAPGGRINDRVINIAKSIGYKRLYSSRVGLLRRKISPYNIPRVGIRRNLSIKIFSLIINCSYKYYFPNSIKYYMLLCVKKVLPNDLYCKFHNIYSKNTL